MRHVLSLSFPSKHLGNGCKIYSQQAQPAGDFDKSLDRVSNEDTALVAIDPVQTLPSQAFFNQARDITVSSRTKNHENKRGLTYGESTLGLIASLVLREAISPTATTLHSSPGGKLEYLCLPREAFLPKTYTMPCTTDDSDHLVHDSFCRLVCT